MTSDQAAQLLTAIADLQQQGQALGLLLGQVVVWLQVLSTIGVGCFFWLAVRRQG